MPPCARKHISPFLVLAGVVTLSTLRPATAEAQFRRGHVRGGVFINSGYFYDPFFYDPWFGFGYQYPYPPYPYPPYGYARRFDNSASVRVMVTPRDAEVYVDGYYAGIVDDFDGIFQRLRVPPGDHGNYPLSRGVSQPVHQKMYLAERSDSKLRYTMTPLAAGEANEPRPVAPATPPPGPDQTEPGRYAPQYPPQRMPPQRIPPPDRMPPGPPPQQPGEPAGNAPLRHLVDPRAAGWR